MANGKTRKTLLTSFVLFTVVIGSWWLWQAWANNQEKSPKKITSGSFAIPVTTEKVTLTSVNESANYLATLRSENSVIIQPQVSGWIQNIHVYSGQIVQQGQILFSLSAGPQQAELERLKADLKTTKADLTYQQKELKRYTFLSSKQAVTTEELEEIQRDFNASQSKVESIQAAINAQQEQLNYYTIKAPFAGTVSDIPVKRGDYVSPGTELTYIGNFQNLEVLIPVPANNYKKITTNLNFNILNESGNTEASGTIKFVEPSVDLASQTILLKGKITNTSGQFKPEQRVRTEIVWASHNKPLIPVNAVQRQNTRFSVYTIAQTEHPDVYEATPKVIQIGQIYNNRYVVLNGLTKDDEIITGGIQKLQPGAKVSIANANNNQASSDEKTKVETTEEEI